MEDPIQSLKKKVKKRLLGVCVVLRVRPAVARAVLPHLPPGAASHVVPCVGVTPTIILFS